MTTKFVNANIADKEYNSYVDISKDDKPEFAKRVSFGDSPIVDAFGRLRVSQCNPHFDSMEISGKRTDLWVDVNAGSGSTDHIANQSCVRFNTTIVNGDKATRRSKPLLTYVPGVSVAVHCTGVMGTGAINSYQRIGLFNAQNGVFFEQKDSAMGVVIRTYTAGSVSNNRIERTDWNIDPMDGTGPSGVNLNFTKTQIFFLDLQWLGVGRVRMGFVHNGLAHLCHEFNHNNQLSTVYMTSPLLPITYEVENYGASTALTDFRQICSSIILEGGDSITKNLRSVNTTVTPRATTTTTALPVISLRLQTAFVGLSQLQVGIIQTLVTTGAGSVRDHLFEVIYGGTLESSSFTANSGSAAWDIAATHITGGIKVAGFFCSGADRLNIDESGSHDRHLAEGSTSGQPEIFTVTAKAIGGAGQVSAILDYEEHY